MEFNTGRVYGELVIGGGIDRLTAAVERRFGAQPDLVERELFPGGHLAKLACKAMDTCVKFSACLIAKDK